MGSSLRKIRKARGLTQESFTEVSSRTHMSELERGVIGITVEKLIELSAVMNVHPLTILLDSFSSYEQETPERLLKQIAKEHKKVAKESPEA